MSRWRAHNASVINTEPFFAVGRAIDLLHRRPGIVALVGPARTGKSYAVRTQLRLTETRAVSASVLPDTTPGRLLGSLLAAADATSDQCGTESTLQARLREELTTRPLLILDNAHHLNKLNLKLLRRLHLGPVAACPLVLIGEEPLTRIITSQPWTRRHLLDLIQVEPLDRLDLTEVLANYHPLYRNGDMQALLWIDRVFAHGLWSNWARITATAEQLHRDGVFAKLDRRSAQIVVSHHVR